MRQNHRLDYERRIEPPKRRFSWKRVSVLFVIVLAFYVALGFVVWYFDLVRD
jgi:nitrate reductase NapE component